MEAFTDVCEALLSLKIPTGVFTSVVIRLSSSLFTVKTRTNESVAAINGACPAGGTVSLSWMKART